VGPLRGVLQLAVPGVRADPAQRARGPRSGAVGRDGGADDDRAERVAEDFAGVAVFLASRASDYVTGQTLYVDGGFSVT
jgi:Enoyl-[acyl-carrier-protein] reductase (NADH)